jgi:hypothetical protein
MPLLAGKFLTSQHKQQTRPQPDVKGLKENVIIFAMKYENTLCKAGLIYYCQKM